MSRLSESGTEFERELLASARLDAGSDAGLERTLSAIGVAGAGMAGAAASGAAAGAGGSKAAACVSGSKLGVVVLKWLAVGTMATATTAAIVQRAYLGPLPVPATQTSLPAPGGRQAPLRDTAPAPRPPPVQTPAAPVVGAGPEPSPARVPPPAPSATPPKAPPLMRERTAPAEQGPALSPPERRGAESDPAPPAPRPSATSTLPAEIARLDGVRSALRAGDSAGALRQLDAYHRSSPSGLLGDEAAVLQIDASLSAGERRAALELARRFLSARPKSPHAPRLRALVDSGN